MATELLAIESGADTSSDITIADGETATIFLKYTDGDPIPTGALVYVEIKDDDGNYNFLDKLTSFSTSGVICGEGTYRLRRDGNGVTVGASQG